MLCARACALLSPLAAHAEHHDQDGDNKGRGSSDSAQQQDLAVGRSREVQPVLHGGHVGALALTCSHTLTLSQLMHAREAPQSQRDLRREGTCSVTKFARAQDTAGRGNRTLSGGKSGRWRQPHRSIPLLSCQMCAQESPWNIQHQNNNHFVTRIKQKA